MSVDTQVQARFSALREATARQPRTFDRTVNGQQLKTTELFGSNTFSMTVMEEKLPRADFDKMKRVLRGEGQLDAELANTVAHAVKEWALERGATHYTHWFQPMTGLTAEKHDAFLDFDGAGNPIERLTGSQIIQSEPDASSFPSGGLRATFEARGYTAWDPSSPIFLIDTENGATLCIPSVFISYTGEALDKKTPLLRSMAALEKASKGLLAAIGLPTERVVANLGCEQEYFLVDRAWYALRPDLAIAGRTLVGAPAPKGQSLDDHYFGAVPPRVQAFMQEVEHELYKLGVPAKTRHNEVAPSQFELASIYREANVAVDHNQIIMEVLRRVAQRHEFQVLLHEKPYALVNGSGKHCNWSIATDEGDNLLEPGTSPGDNLRFLAVLASVLSGVQKRQGQLRAAIASHGNDFRLGANEAPPAIISCFLGDTLTRVIDALVSGEGLSPDPERALIELGVSQLPDLVKDNTDRNRTSPMAFTGNKFELRAVGSKQSPAVAITTLNAAVAEAMTALTLRIEKLGGGEAAVLEAVKAVFTETRDIRFEKDGYADAWADMAESRGLLNLRKTPEALAQLTTDGALELFAETGVYTAAELNSRYNVYLEQYVTTVGFEVQLMQSIVDSMVLPAALAERAAVATALNDLVALNAAGITVDLEADKARFALLSQLVSELQGRRTALAAAMQKAHDAGDGEATVCAYDVMPAVEALRATVDQLEGVVADGRWPLPKYRELLFLNCSS